MNEPRRLQFVWLTLGLALLLLAALGWTHLRLREARHSIDALEAETSELEAKNRRLRDELRASDLVARFYATYLERPIGGLPFGPDLERIRPFLSARLAKSIDDALAYQAQFIAEHPDEPSPGGGPPVSYKPPFVDGDHFSSNFEGPTRFEIGEVAPSGQGGWRVTVKFWYAESTEGWEDTVLVVVDSGAPSSAGPPASALSPPTLPTRAGSGCETISPSSRRGASLSPSPGSPTRLSRISA